MSSELRVDKIVPIDGVGVPGTGGGGNTSVQLWWWYNSSRAILSRLGQVHITNTSK